MEAMERLYGKGVNSPAIRALLFCRDMRSSPILGNAAGLGVGLFGLTLHIVLRDHYEGAPFLTLYPAVVVACLLGGTVIGSAVAIIGGAAQWTFFIPLADPIAIASYAIDAVICVSLIDFINRSFDLLLVLLQEEQKSGRRHYLVSRELHHRIQNLFAVVQAVVRLTMPGDNEKCRNLRDQLNDRFQSMAMTNRLISESQENGVSLHELVKAETDTFTSRAHITCPDGVVIGAQLAQNLALILHELIVNAMKHGALSVPEGRVILHLEWDHHRTLCLRWREADGPIVNRSDKSGFGSRLLNNFAKRLGSVRMDYSRTGFAYSLKIDSGEIWLGVVTIMRDAA